MCCGRFYGHGQIYGQLNNYPILFRAGLLQSARKSIGDYHTMNLYTTLYMYFQANLALDKHPYSFFFNYFYFNTKYLMPPIQIGCATQ